jgi:cyclopropane-fatty-acyl-phospholipid synthase
LCLRHEEEFYRRLAAGGFIGFGEAFQAGDWTSANLTGLLTALLAYTDRAWLARLRRLRRFVGPRRPAAARNTLRGAARNVSYHYDLSNDFFRLFLDETMTYSSAIFRPAELNDQGTGQVALRSAQLRKIDRLLDLTRVGKGSRVLELGTGWGELAVRAAARGADVRTITLSEQQARYAADRVRRAGLAHAVQVELADFRHIEPSLDTYDAIICVEMFEGIGEENWTRFFVLLDRLLAPAGRVGLHSITARDDRFEVLRHRHSWITKHIFPGWQLPSAGVLNELVRRHTTLSVLDTASFGPHYAETLRVWRQTFQQNESKVRQLGFDDVFLRTWLFYLASCEAAFRAGHFGVHHLVLGRSE